MNEKGQTELLAFPFLFFILGLTFLIQGIKGDLAMPKTGIIIGGAIILFFLWFCYKVLRTYLRYGRRK